MTSSSWTSAIASAWRAWRARRSRPDFELERLAAGGVDERLFLTTALIDLLRDRRAERRSRLGKAFLYFLMFALPAVLYIGFFGWSAGLRFGPAGDVVGIVRLDGEMADGTAASADRVIPALRKAFESSQVRAVVLSIDSPGGAPLEAERIYSAIGALKQQHPKPVVAVINNLGASAAYMVALHADRIVAGKYSLVGSIGAVLSGWDAHEGLNRLGISQRVYASGDLKAMMNPYLPMTPEADRKARELVAEMGRAFRTELETRRKERLAPGVDYASGGVWGGSEAHRLGLVDELGTLDQVIATGWPGLPAHNFGPRENASPLGLQATSWLRSVLQGALAAPPVLR